MWKGTSGIARAWWPVVLLGLSSTLQAEETEAPALVFEYELYPEDEAEDTSPCRVSRISEHLILVYRKGLSCLHPETGEVRWSIQDDGILGWESVEPLTDTIGIVSHERSARQLMLFDFSKGKLIWRRPEPSPNAIHESSYARLPDGLIVTLDSGEVMSLAADGSRLWTVTIASLQEEVQKLWKRYRGGFSPEVREVRVRGKTEVRGKFVLVPLVSQELLILTREGDYAGVLGGWKTMQGYPIERTVLAGDRIFQVGKFPHYQLVTVDADSLEVLRREAIKPEPKNLDLGVTLFPEADPALLTFAAIGRKEERMTFFLVADASEPRLLPLPLDLKTLLSYRPPYTLMEAHDGELVVVDAAQGKLIWSISKRDRKEQALVATRGMLQETAWICPRRLPDGSSQLVGFELPSAARWAYPVEQWEPGNRPKLVELQERLFLVGEHQLWRVAVEPGGGMRVLWKWNCGEERLSPDELFSDVERGQLYVRVARRLVVLREKRAEESSR